MVMDWKQKTGIGAALAVFGALGILLGPVLGVGELARPLGFIAGFIVGMVTGMGVALSISGLWQRRNEK